MKLSQLAAKPQLIQLSIDDAETIKEFGEALDFWTWDRQPLEAFMKLANVKSDDQVALVEIVRTMILDEEGKQIISGEITLPKNALISAVGKIVDLLGK